jgi:fumarate reductase flavoprotein subunit
LARGAAELNHVRARLADLCIEDDSRTFNTERVAALELGFMVDIADTIIAAAAKREESRGAHQRTDFPARDDVRFLSHSLVYRNADGSPRVDYSPVTITRWPPAERVYGEAAAHAGTHQGTGSTLPAGEAV